MGGSVEGDNLDGSLNSERQGAVLRNCQVLTEVFIVKCSLTGLFCKSSGCHGQAGNDPTLGWGRI